MVFHVVIHIPNLSCKWQDQRKFFIIGQIIADFVSKMKTMTCRLAEEVICENRKCRRLFAIVNNCRWLNVNFTLLFGSPLIATLHTCLCHIILARILGRQLQR